MSKGIDIRDLRTAAEQNPNSVNAHLRLGTALAQRSQLPEAEAAIKHALELDPQCAGAWVNLGGIRLTAMDFAGCVEANNKALECDPKLALAYYNRGLAHLYLNEPDEMLACFEKVVSLEPDNGAGHYHYAVALHAKGRTQEAYDQLGRASDLGHSPEPRFLKVVQKAVEKLDGASTAEPIENSNSKAKN